MLVAVAEVAAASVVVGEVAAGVGRPTQNRKRKLHKHCYKLYENHIMINIDRQHF